MPYAVLLPDGYKDGAPLPLLLFLHGGGGDRSALTRVRDIFDELWKEGRLPKMVVATPSVSPRCFYMDYKDGTEKWETFIVGPFREFLQKTYKASTDPKKNMLMARRWVAWARSGWVSMGITGTNSPSRNKSRCAAS